MRVSTRRTRTDAGAGTRSAAHSIRTCGTACAGHGGGNLHDYGCYAMLLICIINYGGEPDYCSACVGDYDKHYGDSYDYRCVCD